ncbi:MAG: RNA polymerase sigma factor [Acidimicrobiales bacterium]
MVEPESDTDLVRRARAGDHTAFTTLVREQDHKMRGLAYQLLGSRSQMDDALQDAYLKAYVGLSSFRSESAFGTWLYRIVYTTCIDHIRRRDRRREVGLHVVPDQPDVLETAEVVERHDEVRNALDSLTPDHRAALLLVDREGLSYDEVAHVMDITPGTVASRLSRARTAFKAALNPNSPTPETNR